jgi:rhodanese-related sulfurtransferase
VSEQSPTQVDEIAPPDLQASLQAGEVQLVDVRTQHEWDAGHIAGATHIELSGLTAETEQLDRDRRLVFYCRGGNRSGMAAQAFAEAGYEVAKLAGGISAWAAAGLQLEPDGGYVAESGEAAAVLESRRRAARSA